MHIGFFIIIDFNFHYNMNKMCKGFKNNDYLFLIFQMPFFKHCIFSIFKLLIFLFLLSIFLFLHLWITGFLHFTFAVPLYLKNYLTTETQFFILSELVLSHFWSTMCTYYFVTKLVLQKLLCYFAQSLTTKFRSYIPDSHFYRKQEKRFNATIKNNLKQIIMKVLRIRELQINLARTCTMNTDLTEYN